MWPWEHAAVGYLSVSLYYRFRGRPPPDDAVAVAVLLGTQFPDLVDKPLAWWVAVLPSGHSLAHSLPVALALSGVAAGLTHYFGSPAVGVAYGVGYLTHLAGDALYPALLGGDVAFAFLVAPLAGGGAAPGPAPGLFEMVAVFWGQFVSFLGTPRGLVYLGGELAVTGGAVLAWLLDGRPGSPRFWATFRGTEPE